MIGWGTHPFFGGSEDDPRYLGTSIQKLGIGPEQVRFHWRQYFNQRYSPEGAIADLVQKQKLYPQLGILPSGEKV
jgi:hypothetical protein